LDVMSRRLVHRQMHFITQYESPYGVMAFSFVLQIAFEQVRDA
jgi:hypothetical protein